MLRRKKTSKPTLTRTYKYRIYPTGGQVTALENTFSMCRHLWNWSLAERSDTYEQTGKGVSYFTQQNRLPELKDERPWFKGVHSQVLQDVLRRLDKGFESFFRRVKEGAEEPSYPKFKKRGQWTSITYPQYKLYPSAVRVPIPKIGEVRIVFHRPIPKLAKIKTMTVMKEAANRWFVSFSFEIPVILDTPSDESRDFIGIDLGCIDLYYASDESHVEAPRHFRAAQANLKKLQRRFSKAKKRTPRWYRLLRALGKAHAKVRRKRQHFLHEEANALLDRADVVVCEDLKIANMTRRPKPRQDESGAYIPNGAKAKSGLNKSILDAGWGMFVQILRYKAEERGKQVIAIPPHYTSQMCSACGEIVKKSLSHRTHACVCGFVAHRDHNAALNILRLGLESLEAPAS
jgi:putative transposase